MDALKARIDRIQQRRPATAFPAAVMKKFGDDGGGHLAALVTYYAFLSVFPLLLLFVTITGFVLHEDPGLRRDLVDSALADFPVVGAQLRRNISTMDGNGLALAIGLVGLLWGSLGVAHALQHAMAEIWDVPARDRPPFLARLGRALLLLAVLGTSVLATTGASALVAAVSGPVVAVCSVLVAVAINTALYVAAFRVLTPLPVRIRDLWVGATVGAVFWTGLQLIGGWLVARQLRHASELYGFFGIVLGLLFFLYLAARLSLLAAEVNVVWARRLYPRSILTPSLTEADERVYTDAVVAEARVEEEDIDVDFTRPRRAAPRG